MSGIKYDDISQLPRNMQSQAKKKILDCNLKADEEHWTEKRYRELQDAPPSTFVKREDFPFGVVIPGSVEDQVKSGKKSKYRNVKMLLDGIWFDSKGEANRYSELKLMEKAGEIEFLELQPVWILQAPFTNNQGKKRRAIRYVADFQYIQEEKVIVEDFKGHETQVFKMKQKLFEKEFPEVELRITRR